MIVDDESSVLRALRRGLRLKARDWTLYAEESPQAALDRLQDATPLVVISDKRMPEMDGAAFLQEVKQRSPLSVRVILSGDTTGEAALQVADIAHLLLPKPFELDDLVNVLNAALCLHHLPVSPEIREQISCIRSLPVLPKVYQELVDYLNSTDEPDNQRIAQIISQDVAILSKILQLANSAFFGFRNPASSALDAVVRLGQDLIANLVLCYGLFEQDQADEQRHALLSHEAEKVAALTMSMAAHIGLKRPQTDHSFVVGLLHNVGGLILGENQDNPPLRAAVSGYLLKLWGFDDIMVNAVLYQCDLAAAPTDNCPISSCLHVATQVFAAREAGIAPLSDTSGLDLESLERVGLIDQVTSWLQEATENSPH